MPERATYFDFDLLLERAGTGYRSRVVASPAGEATNDFTLPFAPLELENLVLRLGAATRVLRRLDSSQVEAAKTFGERLYDAVFDGDVRSCFDGSIEAAERQDTGLRIRLRLAGVPELANLPWEYLYLKSQNRFVALSVRTPIVRYVDLPQPPRTLVVTLPVSVLVMISSPSDFPTLDVEREWTNLTTALAPLERQGGVRVERMDDATVEQLQRRLRRSTYNVFHYVGHGGFDSSTQDGVLVLEDDRGRGHPTSAQYLGTLLHDHDPLRLAVLNACDGARTSATDPFAGTAQTLVQQGVPAVVAMQFAISDDAAITLARSFYEAVADGYPIDSALTEARKSILSQGNDVEWGTPVLYLRSGDGRVFDVDRTKAAEAPSPQLDTPVVPPSPEPTPSSSRRLAWVRQPGWPALALVLLVPIAWYLTATIAEWRTHDGKTTTTTTLRAPESRDASTKPETPTRPESAGTEPSLRQRAEAGDPKAQFDLAGLYINGGDGVNVDSAVAADWFRKAADKGHVGAQAMLGALYANGQGVAYDRAEAARWLRKAAEGGIATAQYDLGILLASGDGVAKNWPEALRWFQKAAEQGDAGAQTKVGEAYANGANGSGSPQDFGAAMELFRTAAAQGDAEAEYNIGVLYAKGQGVEENQAQAATWYRKAAEHGNVEGQRALGVALMAGAGVAKDPAEAATWFRKAAERGDVIAQGAVGMMYFDDQWPSADAADAMRWLRRSAEQGYVFAQSTLGRAYVLGRGVPKDRAEAAKWLRKAADQDDTGAQMMLGVLYVDGAGVPRNEAEGVKLLRQAARKGETTAQSELRRLGKTW